MTPVDALRFAITAVAGHRVRSLLSMLAMAIGVGGVIVLTWMGDAGRRYVVGQFASLGTHLLAVLPGRSETVGGAPPVLGETARDLTLDDALALQRSPAVRSVAPVVVGSAPVSSGSLSREATVLGSTPEFLAIRHIGVVRGRAWPPGDPRRATPVCLLGSTLERELFAGRPALGEWLRIGDRRFRVIGILGSEGRSLDLDLDEVAVVPVASAQMLFDSPALFRIVLEARGRDLVDRAEADVKRIIAARHEGEEDVTVVTQQAVLSTFDGILRSLTWAVAGITAISLLVAGILVMNVMVISVAQRREEIGLLKALGAPPGQILGLFLTEAVLLSCAGAAAGVIGGEGATYAIAAFAPVLAPGAPLWVLIAATAIAFTTGLAFGVAPARRAAALRPVEALARR